MEALQDVLIYIVEKYKNIWFEDTEATFKYLEASTKKLIFRSNVVISKLITLRYFAKQNFLR